MKNLKSVNIAIILLLLGTVTLITSAGEPADSRPRAARSIYLGYPAKDSVAFYNELTVRRSTPGSFFMACGFNHGYFGIQEIDGGKKLVIFSVWDPAPKNGEKVPLADQAKVIYHDTEVRVKRFGGEGTGDQSFFDYDWKIGETCRFFLTSQREDDTDPKAQRLRYAAWFFLPARGTWIHLATFSTIAHDAGIGSTCSFVEDFRRDYQSATEVRRAEFGNGWLQDMKGNWKPVLQAEFSAPPPGTEAKDTIDAGLVGGSSKNFFLQTGGNTQTHTSLGATLQRTDSADLKPSDLPAN